MPEIPTRFTPVFSDLLERYQRCISYASTLSPSICYWATPPLQPTCTLRPSSAGKFCSPILLQI